MDEPETLYQRYMSKKRAAVSAEINQATEHVKDKDAAAKLTHPEWDISYSHGFITNLRSRTQHADLRKLRIIALFSDDEWARHIATRIIEAEGFCILPDPE
jgi:hypothetical protein